MSGGLLGALTALLATAALAGGPQDPNMAAQRLVASAGLREGDIVLISGGLGDGEFLDNLAERVRSVGARPVVSRGGGSSYREITTNAALHLGSSESASKPHETVSLQTIVEVGERPAPADLPKAGQPSATSLYSRSVRRLSLGSDLHPTRSNVEVYGLAQGELAKQFWEALALDSAALKLNARALRAALLGGKELRIRHVNGTDLRLRIEGRPIFASDGAVSRQDVRAGVSRSVWLPAGEVYLVPALGSAEGTVVVDRQVFEGKDVLGLALSYKAGKLTSMAAQSGLEPLKARYDASGSGKSSFGVIDLVIDPSARGERLLNFAPAGIVALTLGNNQWAGGTNAATFGLTSVLPGATVTVDGKVIVEAGTLRF